MSDKDTEKKVMMEAPAGFDMRVGRDKGAGWLQKEPGTIIVGRLLGRYEMKGQKNDDGTHRVFYQIRLGDGFKAKANDKVDGESQEVTLKVGDVLNVDEHTALEDLAQYALNGGLYDVWFAYVKQVPIAGTNRKFWEIKGPALKQLKPPTHKPNIPKRSVEAPVGDEDVPF